MTTDAVNLRFTKIFNTEDKFVTSDTSNRSRKPKNVWQVVVAISTLFTFLVTATTFVVVSGLNSHSKDSNNYGGPIWSAMELYSKATGENSYNDLQEIVHFVFSDMGGMWGYRELVPRMDIILFYRPQQAQQDRLKYNSLLQKQLPDRMKTYPLSNPWWAGNASNMNATSCVCPNGDALEYVQILYDEGDAINRVSVVFHEYYHVLQKYYCYEYAYIQTNGPPGPYVLMWLLEGSAATLEQLYVTYWLQNHSLYVDRLFNSTDGVVVTMAKAVQDGTYMFQNRRLESHNGAMENYVASSAAFLYLMYRKGGSSYLKYISTDFVLNSTCILTSPTMDDHFKREFELWNTLSDFYSDVDGFFTDASMNHVDLLRPSTDSITNLFKHNTLCSDTCDLSRNGVCDQSCIFGSDCTDCGPTAIPSNWPVTLNDVYKYTN